MNNIPKLAKFIIIILVGGAFVAACAAAGYFYYQYQQVKQNPDLISQQQVKKVTDSIRQFMDLPDDEEPTLATVTDQEKLKDQDFFKKSQNGDQILIYPKAKKAILYRPSSGRVIEFAPLAIGNTAADSQQTQVGESVKVAIYNGSSVAGLTAEVEEKLKAINGLEVTAKDNAAKKDYAKTIVVDVSGSNLELVTRIAELINGEVGQLPADEKRPDSQVLIIATR